MKEAPAEVRRVVSVASAGDVLPAQPVVAVPPAPKAREIPGDGLDVTPRAHLDCTSMPVHQGYAEMTEDISDWYERTARERAELSAEQKAEADTDTWSWGASLRSQVGSGQQADRALAFWFSPNAKIPPDMRIATDGCLEKQIDSKNRC